MKSVKFYLILHWFWRKNEQAIFAEKMSNFQKAKTGISNSCLTRQSFIGHRCESYIAYRVPLWIRHSFIGYRCESDRALQGTVVNQTELYKVPLCIRQSFIGHRCESDRALQGTVVNQKELYRVPLWIRQSFVGYRCESDMQSMKGRLKICLPLNQVYLLL